MMKPPIHGFRLPSGSEPKVFALVATAGGIIMASVKALWMARRNGHNGRDRSRAGGPARDERGGGRLSAKLHVVIVILLKCFIFMFFLQIRKTSSTYHRWRRPTT